MYSYDRTAGNRQAGSDVPLDALISENPWVKGLLSTLARHGFKQVRQVWSSIHGNIIGFAKGPGRLTPADLKALSKIPHVRWFQFDNFHGTQGADVGIDGTWIDLD